MSEPTTQQQLKDRKELEIIKVEGHEDGIWWVLGKKQPQDEPIQYPPGTDHPHRRLLNTKRQVVSEPYDLDATTLMQMINFAEAHGLTFHIDGIGDYGHGTFRVVWEAAD